MAGYNRRSFMSVAVGVAFTLAVTMSITLSHFDTLFKASSTDSPWSMAFAYSDAPQNFAYVLQTTPDLADFIVTAPEHPKADQRSISAAEAAYHVSRQPGQAWRIATDTYRHIDPGRRLSL